MTKRYCQTGRIECPHLPACGEECAFDTASQKKIYTFIKAGEEVQEDDSWRAIGYFMIFAAFAILILFFVLLFFAGYYTYSLL